MYKKRHIKNKFKIKKPITNGTPKIELPITVYSLIGKLTLVNFLVKQIVNNIVIPNKAFDNKNLIGLRLLIEIIMI